jgi:hypothetical protein
MSNDKRPLLAGEVPSERYDAGWAEGGEDSTPKRFRSAPLKLRVDTSAGFVAPARPRSASDSESNNKGETERLVFIDSPLMRKHARVACFVEAFDAWFMLWQSMCPWLFGAWSVMRD